MVRTAPIALSFVACLSVLIQADDAPKGEADKGKFFERMVKEFDADGDGKLSDAERATAVRAAEQFIGRMKERGDGRGRPEFGDALKRFDKDGDGQLSDDEKAAAVKARGEFGKQGQPGRLNLNDPPEFVLKRFDKDGDGKLNEDEKKAVTEAMAKFPGGPPGMPNREEMVKRFDKDGDGKLNESEEAAARAEMEKRRGAGGGAAGGLTPGEGKPQESKLQKDELIKKFDKDGDGQLNADEKAAARAAFQNRDK